MNIGEFNKCHKFTNLEEKIYQKLYYVKKNKLKLNN